MSDVGFPPDVGCQTSVIVLSTYRYFEEFVLEIYSVVAV
jgi:hypothetical protein